MNPTELAKAYQGFFFKSLAGQQFMEWLQGMETNHIDKAQSNNDLSELNKSAGNKEVAQHITSVIAQVADQ